MPKPITRWLASTSIPLVCLAAPIQVLAQGGTSPEPINKKSPTLKGLMSPTVQKLERQLQKQQRQLQRQQRQIRALQGARGRPRQPAQKPGRSRPGPAEQNQRPSRPNNVRLGNTTRNTQTTAPSKSGGVKIPGSDVTFTIGGYIKGDVNHTFGGTAGNERLFIPALIPVDGVDGPNVESRDGSTRAFANQSRIHISLSRPDTAFGGFKAYIEGDFFGNGGNQILTNSNSFRLRHAYGVLGHLLVGKTWTTFEDPSAYPATLQFEPPNGSVFIRQGQIRWTQPVSDKLNVAFAVENPETTFQNDFDRLPNNPQNTRNSDPYPDGVVRGRYSGDFGHLQVGGLLRGLTVQNDAGFDESKLGYGVNVSGAIDLPALGSQDNFKFQVNYGDGIGRYILDVGRGGAATAIDGNDLETLKALGGYVSYQHWWTDTVRSTAVYGHVNLKTKSFQADGALNNTDYATLNLVWSPIVFVNLGVEYEWGRRQVKSGASARAGRLQTSAQFFF